MLINILMVKPVEVVGPDVPLRDVARMMRDKAIGCLPVCENEQLIGIIADRDIVCRGVADGLDIMRGQTRDIMTKNVVYCFDDQSDAEAAKLMEDNEVRHLPVLNRKMKIVGMVTLGDLALRSKTLTRTLLGIIERDALRREKLHSTHAW
ncbi:MAG: CBS domain-containing protein [Bacteroidota bacterium]|nr:CBS domain-containing protein [Bacteroidota bacterium]